VVVQALVTALVRRRDAALATAAWDGAERRHRGRQHRSRSANIALPSGKVRVRKGAPLRGTGNHVPETTGTSYVIKVVSVDEGYVFDDGRTITLRNQTVHWAGRAATGGGRCDQRRANLALVAYRLGRRCGDNARHRPA